MEDLWLSEKSMDESPFDGSEQEETQGMLKQQDYRTAQLWVILLIWIRLRESHVKYRVTENHFYWVTGVLELECWSNLELLSAQREWLGSLSCRQIGRKKNKGVSKSWWSHHLYHQPPQTSAGKELSSGSLQWNMSKCPSFWDCEAFVLSYLPLIHDATKCATPEGVT